MCFSPCVFIFNYTIITFCIDQGIKHCFWYQGIVQKYKRFSYGRSYLQREEVVRILNKVVEVKTRPNRQKQCV